MPVKEWVRQFQPVQLYIILAFTIIFFLIELVVSHLTHALTLLMDSYHMLCNILALAGCIFTIKYGNLTDPNSKDFAKENSSSSGEELSLQTVESPMKSQKVKVQEKKLKNTFGWARIDVVAMLMCCVFLASLCFSLVLEALQTLVHIDHLDEMHHPIPVICIGGAGLLLNGACYLLIGGYTFHQGSFLHVTESGDVVLDKVVISESVTKGEKQLSRSRPTSSTSQPKQRQGLQEICRDGLGCIFVIVCAFLVYISDKSAAKYIDPIISIFSASTLMFFSFPYLKESCLILLQTMPDSIDIDSLRIALLKQFPGIINVHDFHIWQLTANKIVSTVHIIFQNPKTYESIAKQVTDFFTENGITLVTIQPEFVKNIDTTVISNKNCLMQCREELCKLRICCLDQDISSKTQSSKFKSKSKEIVPGISECSLTSIKTNSEFSNTSPSPSADGSAASVKSDDSGNNEEHETRKSVEQQELEVLNKKKDIISKVELTS